MGIPPAAYNMANMYAIGQGTPQSDTNAFTCYEIAAESGDSMAKYILGLWLLEGRGCEKKNIPRGLSLLVKHIVLHVMPEFMYLLCVSYVNLSVLTVLSTEGNSKCRESPCCP